MSDAEQFFSDGVAYERRMGLWSRLVGEVFLDWLGAPAGLRWLDVGIVQDPGRTGRPCNPQDVAA